MLTYIAPIVRTGWGSFQRTGDPVNWDSDFILVMDKITELLHTRCGISSNPLLHGVGDARSRWNSTHIDDVRGGRWFSFINNNIHIRPLRPAISSNLTDPFVIRPLIGIAIHPQNSPINPTQRTRYSLRGRIRRYWINRETGIINLAPIINAIRGLVSRYNVYQLYITEQQAQLDRECAEHNARRERELQEARQRQEHTRELANIYHVNNNNGREALDFYVRENLYFLQLRLPKHDLFKILCTLKTCRESSVCAIRE